MVVSFGMLSSVLIGGVLLFGLGWMVVILFLSILYVVVLVFYIVIRVFVVGWNFLMVF